MLHVVLLPLRSSRYSLAIISSLDRFANFAYFTFTLAKPFFTTCGLQSFTSRVRVKQFVYVVSC